MKLGATAAFSLALALPAASRDCPDIELTGYANLGTSQIVCLSIQPGERHLVLHPGESADGVTLESVDFANRSVVVKWDTNGIKLYLVNRWPSASANPGEAGAIAAVAGTSGPPVRTPVSPDPFASPLVTETANGQASIPGNSYSNLMLQGRRGSGTPPPARKLEPAEPSGSPTDRRAFAQNGHADDFSPTASPIADNSIASIPDASSQLETAPGRQDQQPPDPVEQERERIRTLQGQDALMAWDIAHYNPATGQLSLDL